ncbi:MAG: hypothetical protein ABJH68_17915 [Ilumatobacter sp.]|uniref:hypothetical protein n=1 Tax=Ilumatobacter sp. TaxID=1967498 RepID=UPI0032994EA7
MIEARPAASCAFEACPASMIERVVVAAVEQLCAHDDVTVELLEALEFPLGEALVAAAGLGITKVDLDVSAGRLHVEVHLLVPPESPSVVLGDAADVVSAFFDVAALTESSGLSLTGPLG